MSIFYEDKQIIQRVYNFDAITDKINLFLNIVTMGDVVCTGARNQWSGIEISLKSSSWNYNGEGVPVEPDECYSDDDIEGFAKFLDDFSKELGCLIAVPSYYYPK